jgi:hypothetical protein
MVVRKFDGGTKSNLGRRSDGVKGRGTNWHGG